MPSPDASSVSPASKSNLALAASLPNHDERPPLPIPFRSALATLIQSRSAAAASAHNHHHAAGSPSAQARHGFLSGGSSPGAAPSSLGAGPVLDDVYAAAVADDNKRSAAAERRLSQIINGPQMRSMRLIGKSNARYQWDRYWKTDQELKKMPKKVREYYERTNNLIQQYLFIDHLLDSSRPHDILKEYESSPEPNTAACDPTTFSPFSGGSDPRPLAITYRDAPPQQGPTPGEGNAAASSPQRVGAENASYGSVSQTTLAAKKMKRTPKEIVSSSSNTKGGAGAGAVAVSVSEATPLLRHGGDADATGIDPPLASDNSRHAIDIEAAAADGGPKRDVDGWLENGEVDSQSRVVAIAIWVNFLANAVLLASKVVVIAWVPSMSVLASLVDAALDFLSTVIVWLTTKLISKSQHDQYHYPVGRRRLEPLGVVVFSVVMITSFVQVAIQCLERLASSKHELIELGVPAIGIMASTVVIKGAVWLYYRLVRNSSVRALADDAKTDVIFNFGSILFPIIGFYARVWWLDALGGMLLSIVVIVNWSSSCLVHVRNLSGFSALPDERNLLLYLTMRFATTIRQIQNLRAYHAGDKLFVEADIVLDPTTPLRDSHDLGEVLTYFLESVPFVDRAFVHIDYASYHAPTHLLQGVDEEDD